MTQVQGLSQKVRGEVVAAVTQPSPDTIVIHLDGGAGVVIQGGADGVSARLERGGTKTSGGQSKHMPTKRQREYLEFIRKFMARFGRSPSETDIRQHFMVSAPSAHAMVKTLERRGFITRGRDWSGAVVPRSIRVLWEGDAY